MTKVASLSPRVILELNHQFIHNTHSSLAWFGFFFMIEEISVKRQKVESQTTGNT